MECWDSAAWTMEGPGSQGEDCIPSAQPSPTQVKLLTNPSSIPSLRNVSSQDLDVVLDAEGCEPCHPLAWVGLL